MHGNHLSSQMTALPVLEQDMLPYSRRFTDPLHEVGMKAVWHADAVDLCQCIDVSNLNDYDQILVCLLEVLRTGYLPMVGGSTTPPTPRSTVLFRVSGLVLDARTIVYESRGSQALLAVEQTVSFFSGH